jgi:ribonucleoside-diphosphate reductase alpha chain
MWRDDVGARPARRRGHSRARTLWDEIGFAAWRCADPGVQYDDTINAWHTCPNGGRINASNPCVTGDTLVATTSGLRRIRDMVGGAAEIINGRGEKAFVNNIFPTGRKPVYDLKTESGYTLRLTADHKVETVNRGDVPACELTRDDIVTLRGAGFGDDFVPEPFAELLGAAVGDGCITHQPQQDFLFVSSDRAEGDVADRLRGHIDHCKHWLSSGDARSTRPSKITTTATGLRVGTSVSTLIERLAQYAVLDQGSAQKSFHDAIFALDRRSVAAILRGLFTSDGTVADYADKSQYVALDSTSLTLLRQVQVLLLGFGIKAKIYENRRAGGATTVQMPDGRGGQADYPVQQMHSLRISRSSRLVFEREIGFIPGSVKNDRLRALNQRVAAYADTFTDRVRSLTAAGTEDVFDLTEPASHHFVANGIVVHNCSEYMFLDNTACNLASLNVLTFYSDATRAFDVERYEHGIDLWTTVLEISVLMAAFPSREIARLSFQYRTLGLGYANLGAMLMRAGIPYDSDEARAVCAMLTSILTGRSYRQSAALAAEHGAFAGYGADQDNMLRIIRNHRRAAHGAKRDAAEYESLRIRPVPIDHALVKSGRINLANAGALLTRATLAWDEALALGEKHGYRNAQTTVIAPTGTIGLLMDCDTTGVEPDFALVKFKKLAGGGYFKIANASVEPALVGLGYAPAEVRAIMQHLMGALDLDVPMPAGAPGAQPGQTFAQWLRGKGLSDADLQRIAAALPGVFELRFAFGSWALGDEALNRLGFDAEVVKKETPPSTP